MVSENLQKVVAEFIGTFLLVFTVGCNVVGAGKTPLGAVWAGVSIGCVLMVSIYSLGKVSGANFNPAVSVAIGTSTAMKGPGNMTWGTVGMYVGAQLFAAFLASFSYAILYWEAFNLGPSKGFGWATAGLCELLYTFLLCFVVLNVAVAKDTEQAGNEYYGLAIGFVIIAGAYGAGGVSGGCFNPAVAFGIDLSSAFLGFGWCVVYAVFELLGAVLAAAAFKLVRPQEFTGRQAGMKSKLVCEFLGTFILVLTVGLNVLGGSQAGALSIASALMCMIYAVGDISGANFNPAVTLAIMASKSVTGNTMTGSEAGQYIAAQLAGGIVASLMYMFVHHGKAFPLGAGPGYHWGQAAIAEIIFTFVLCFVVLCTAVHSKTKAKTMFGLAIGSCVTVGGFAIGSISGGSLNPAVSFGIATGSVIENPKNLMQFGTAAAYSAFECIGAAAAAGAIMVTHGVTKPALTA